VVNEVKPQKHTYVCSEERAVVSHAVLTGVEVRAPLTSAQWRASGVRLVTVNKGQSEISGLDYRTGILESQEAINAAFSREVDSLVSL